MKVLFIGGTGNISTSCTKEALARGFEVHHLNRGMTASPFGNRVTVHRADIKDRNSVEDALRGERFDVIVDWLVYTKDDIEADIQMFKGVTSQYVFISSASVYHKPPRHYMITESELAYNPYWPMSQRKTECEQRLREAYTRDGFPMTIVRPSHTYSDGWFPSTFGKGFTVPQRMLDGKEIIVHGDGTSLWTLTHSDDFAMGFVGLLGNPDAIGETFHITTDEAVTWNQVHYHMAAALGVTPKIVHIPSEVIYRYFPDTGVGLMGDRAHSLIFDNTKIKRFVPGFQCRISFHEGMRRSVAWWQSRPELPRVEEKVERDIESMLQKWSVLK